MSSQCSAITNAMNAKGLNSSTLASQAGLTSQRVDAILTGGVKPNQQEFNAIATALNLSSAPAHAAKVIAA